MQFEPSASVAPQTPVHRSEVFIRSLDHLFAMAQRYRSEGRIRESMDILWTLSNDHSETPQGRGAQDGLLELADRYETDGARHQARAIYERLSDS
jgi:hypothetical protein